MQFFNISLVALVSGGLLLLGACSSDNKAKTETTITSAPAVKTESTTTSTPAAKTETTTATKDREKHSEGDGHKHAAEGKDGHSGQVVQVGKYHVEFKPDPDKDTIHLDTVLHGDSDKQIVDAKLTAQVQLPDGSNKTLPVTYNTEEKQYTAKLPVGGAGDYKVVMQFDVKGEKFNSRFSFKK